MFKGFKKYLLLVVLIIMFSPVTVLADNDVEVNQNNEEIVDESNNSNLLLLNNNNFDNEELNQIRDIIGQEINVDLVESQSYDFVIEDEDYYSVLDNAVSDVVLDRMNNSEFDYSTLGYTFVSDCVRYNGFDYNGTINVYKDDSLVDSFGVTVNYLNSDQHTQIEQDYVDEFVASNVFFFEEEVYLEDYENITFNLDEELNDFSSGYGILCKSMLPPFSGVNYDFLYACFFDDKYYSTLIANYGISTIVVVPSDVAEADQESYALDEVKNYFIGYFEDLGIDNIVTSDSELFFSGDYIYSDDICLGKFVIEVEQVVEPIPDPVPAPIVIPEPQVNPTPSSSSQQETHYYPRTYRTTYTRYYYTDDYEDDSQVGSTLGNDNTVDVTEILDAKNKNDEIKSKPTAKVEKPKETKKEESKDENKSSDKKGINVKKVLLIVLSSITLIGVIVAIVNKLFVHPDSEI